MWVLGPLALQSQEVVPLSPPDLKPENALTRIKQRNLFLIGRGAPSLGGNSAPARILPMPVLVGTVLSRTARAAILRPAGGTESLHLAVGEKCGGFLLVDIEVDRVEVEVLATGEKRWLGLEQSQEAKESVQGSDFEQLLKKSVPSPKDPARPEVIR